MTKQYYTTITHTFTEEDDIAIAKALTEALNVVLPTIQEKKPPIAKDTIFSPPSFSDYIGQEKIKEFACIMVDAALKEKRPIPNILIDSPYGLGKTTLAILISKRAGVEPVIYDGATIAKNMPTTGTIIIDEIHNVEPEICDSLNILLDRGDLSVVGCTTNVGALPAAFRSRFRRLHLESYTVEDLTEILNRVVKRKGVGAPRKLLTHIAKRSRYTARIAINYLATVFDYMSVREEGTLTQKTLFDVFDNLGLDDFGFLPRDYEYLKLLADAGRPVGLQYLEAALNIDKTTIEEEVEPYLMRMGLIDRTPRGRIFIKEIG